MLSLHDISAGYGGTLVLRNVTIEVAQGEFVGIIGPNGCGKTTLLRVAAAFCCPRVRSNSKAAVCKRSPGATGKDRGMPAATPCVDWPSRSTSLP